MAHDQTLDDLEQITLDAMCAALERTDPAQAALFRHVSAMLTAMEQALAVHGLHPLDDDTPDRAVQGNHPHDTPTFRVTQIGTDLLVTDEAGQLIAASGDLVVLWALGAWAGTPGWMGDQLVKTA